MRLWDAITGRTKPKKAQLDALFGVPSAAITLQTSMGLAPTGTGSVCYRAATGAGFAQTQADLFALLGTTPDVPTPEITQDSYGFTWLVLRRDPADLAGLCTDLHGVNTTLELHGYGGGLLCSLVGFADAGGRPLGLVYLYKKGTFYPFAPTGPQQRDNLLEIGVRDTLAGELPMEPELASWMALWDAPGL